MSRRLAERCHTQKDNRNAGREVSSITSILRCTLPTSEPEFKMLIKGGKRRCSSWYDYLEVTKTDENGRTGVSHQVSLLPSTFLTRTDLFTAVSPSNLPLSIQLCSRSCYPLLLPRLASFHLSTVRHSKARNVYASLRLSLASSSTCLPSAPPPDFAPPSLHILSTLTLGNDAHIPGPHLSSPSVITRGDAPSRWASMLTIPVPAPSSRTDFPFKSNRGFFAPSMVSPPVSSFREASVR